MQFTDESLEDLLIDEDIDFDFDDLDDESPELQLQDDADEYFDVADKILKLSDRLSEDIILRNIESQMTGKLVPYAKRFNYITLFKKKINSINKNSSIYSKEYIDNVSERVKELVLNIMKEKYSVSIGNESDFYFPAQYLEALEAIYEFFFVRHFENLVNYFLYMIRKMNTQIVSKFTVQLQEDSTANDIFLLALRKKFKNEDDIIIIHFLSEIVDFIIESFDSAFDLFNDIADSDPFEVTSIYIKKLLENYGNGIIFKNDRDAYLKYFEPVTSGEVRNELLNDIKMRFLEDCQLNEDVYQDDGPEMRIEVES